MVNSIFIFNKDKRIVDTLSNNGDSPKSPFFDDKYVQHLDTGAETFEFTTISNDRTSKYCEVGAFVGFKYQNKVKMFQIVETSEDHSEGAVLKTCYCEVAGLELINFVTRPIEMQSANVRQFFESVLQGTSWTLGKVDISLSKVKTVKVDKATNVYSVIQDNIQDFECEVEYRIEMSGTRVIGQYIDIYSTRGRETNKRFEYGINVSDVGKQIDISELYTAMIGIGKGGLDFKEAEWLSDKPAPKPKNQDFIVNPSAYEQWNKQGEQLLGVYENAECENPYELLQLTWNTLVGHSVPKFTYNISTEMIKGDEEEVQIGDTVYVIDSDYEPALHLSARVGQLELSFTDHTKNKCILTNFKDVKSGILSLETIQAIIDGKFPISGNEILDGTITGDKIGQGQITGLLIQADTIQAKHIEANQIETKHLRAGAITADKAIIADAAIKSAQIQDASITTAHIKNLAVDTAKINDAAINSAKIQDLAVGTAQIADAAISNAKIGSLAVGTANIKDASINNAKIKDLSADKITAGDINVDRLTANVISAINASLGKIDADHITVGKIDAGEITTGSLDAERIKVSVIEAINASIGSATIDQAKIGDLSADKITSGSIATDQLKANAIAAVNATIGSATINSAKIDNLDASKITTGTLNADRIGAGTIDAKKISAEAINAIGVNASEVVADKITAGNIKIGNANLVDASIGGAKIVNASINNAQIANATIESAKIKSIDAQKITTGKLDTSKVNVSSLSGNLSIANNTIQIKDNQSTPVVRVQLGEDATKDYGLIIKDKSGKIMWDFTGATSDGIQNNAVTTDKIKDDSISSNKLQIGEIWASEGFIENFKAQEIDADKITTGSIRGDLINIKGLVSFESLDTDMQQNFTPTKDSQGNIDKVWINGSAIAANSIEADKIKTRGFLATDNAGNTTFNIDKETGKVSMSGLVESIDFSDVEGHYRGYQLSPNGRATLNNAVVRGSVILPNAGITNAPNSSFLKASADSREVRFWAGADYLDRLNAPFIVYNDGKIKATEGDFGGTFTGKISIGNIHIQDTNNSKGAIEIKTNNNTETKIRLEEDNSYIKSNLTLGTNFINFNTINSIMSMKGILELANGSHSMKINNGIDLLTTSDGVGKHTTSYRQGTLVNNSMGSNTGADFRFAKNNEDNPAKVEIMGELYVRDKMMMNNNIAIVARQDVGNSGFDYVVR